MKQTSDHEITVRIHTCYPWEDWAVLVKTMLDNHSIKYDRSSVYVEGVARHCMGKKHNWLVEQLILVKINLFKFNNM